MSDKQTSFPRAYSNWLLRRHNLLFDSDRRFWWYDKNSGLWKDNAAVVLEKDLRQKLLPKTKLGISRNIVGEILADVQSLSSQQVNLSEPTWHLIPFENGYYDLKTEGFYEYSSEMHFVSKLQMAYDEKATCPYVDTIFGQLLPDDRVIDLYELVAYSLLRSYPYQKVFFLYGSGANGKSVFARILEMLIGQHNISHVSLTDFQKNRFSGAELHKKFINVCNELDYQDLTKTDVLKQLTGGDSIKVEKKFQHPFNFINYAKLIFLTNELPRTTDKTNAFYRRVFLINFPFVFDGEKADRNLLNNIGPGEIKGLAFKSLMILKKMMERGFAFINDKSAAATMDDYERISNPFDTFINEFYEEDPTEAIPKQVFKEAFLSWITDKGYRIWDDKAIKKAMFERNIIERRIPVYGKRLFCWIGLKRIRES